MFRSARDHGAFSIGKASVVSFEHRLMIRAAQANATQLN
jgi:hypothetical protein